MRNFTKKAVVAALVTSTLALSGCTSDAGPNQTGGALLGAGLGAQVGAQLGHGDGRAAATAIGALAGAAVGSNIGKRLDDVDRMRMREAEQRAYNAPLNEPIIWNNPNTGHSGTVTPTREGRRPNGEYCREFQSNITVGGQSEKGYGTACRQADGSWKIVS
ncbi:MAG: glycine zipper 2TM domain-containing protein [Rhodospirillaceae bacterium]|nr:glycine zipper 2TM domain-containing protein [Rhodospirillaceae bacterium]